MSKMSYKKEGKIPPEARKHLFESNAQYRTYFYKEQCYHEQYINGQWLYVKNIPCDAYVKYVGKVQVI